MGDHIVHVRRVYGELENDGSARVLVDRRWPRGIRKENLGLDEWLRDLAATPALCDWYDLAPDRFAEFGDRYRAEIQESGIQQWHQLRDLHAQGPLTILTANKDAEHSHAAVLAALLRVE